MNQKEQLTDLFLLPFVCRYDFFKHQLIDSGLYKDGIFLHFSASFLAGTVATIVCSPAE